MTGKIYSIDKVRDELMEGEDELKQWAKDLDKGFFKDIDNSASSKLEQISEWVRSKNYKPAAKNIFFTNADCFIVSYALAHGYTVVTNEVTDPKSKRKIKIPDVCMGVGVNCIQLHTMLRDEGAKFVLDKEKKTDLYG